jgi:hypothetical protein
MEENEVSDKEGDNDDTHFSFHVSDNITITLAQMTDKNWIRLDSEFTLSIFSNKKLLHNFQRCRAERGLQGAQRNGGFQDTHLAQHGVTKDPMQTSFPLLPRARFAKSPWTPWRKPQLLRAPNTRAIK